MEEFTFLRPPEIDEAVWSPQVPLVVLERCPTAQHVAVWLAFRWLMAAFPRRRGFTAEEIARRAKVSQQYLYKGKPRAGEERRPGWAEDLAQLGLLVKVGEERRPNWHGARPLYTIPLRELAEASAAMALDVLVAWGWAPDTPPPPNPAQAALPLDDHLDDRTTITQAIVPGATITQEIVPRSPRRSYQEPRSPRRSYHDHLDDRRPAANGSGGSHDHLDDRTTITQAIENADSAIPGREDGREGGREDARTPAQAPNIPEPPPNELPLPDSPLNLWTRACVQIRTNDADQLAALGAQYDRRTDGYGAYWVGRAILAATVGQAARSLRVVTTVLARWDREQSWGSELPPTARGTDARTNRPRAAGRLAATGERRDTADAPPAVRQRRRATVEMVAPPPAPRPAPDAPDGDGHETLP